MNDLPESAELFLDGARGQYIPQNFAEIVIRECVEGVTDEDWECLEAGPEHEWYWEAWNNVLNRAILTNPSGERFTLYQDDDLWMIPEDADWPDPWAEDDLMDWDEQDARAAEEERVEMHRREQ